MKSEEHMEEDRQGPVDRAPGREVNVAMEVDRLRAFKTFSLRGYRAKSLLRTDTLAVVLMVFRKGAQIRHRRSQHPVTLVSLFGNLRVGFAGDSRVLAPKDMGAIPIGVAYDLEALHDCDALLIVDRSPGLRLALAMNVLA